MPSFMAKWSAQYPGCSGHIHQSLSDGKTNRFYDPKGAHGMSKLFESYLAGQVAALMQFAPMFWPTINSYKRLVDGFWAPVKPTWGIDNRTASFRVIPGSPKSTRLETRCPGADVNPYLAMAAVIAAGLHGVEKNLKLTRQADHRHQPGRRERSARAAHADRDDAHLRALGHRPRLAGRRVRRPLRGDARMGMAPMARRGHRLGTEALLRDHLGRRHGRHPNPTPPQGTRPMGIERFSFPTTIHFGAGARRLVAEHLKAQGCTRPLVVTDRGIAQLPLLRNFLDRAAGPRRGRVLRGRRQSGARPR